MKRSVKRARQRDLKEQIAAIKSQPEESKETDDMREQFISKFSTNQSLADKRSGKVLSKTSSKQDQEVSAMFEVVSKC